MKEYIEVINKNLPRFTEKLCIIQKDGPCREYGELTIKSFEINQNSELIIKIKEIEIFFYAINLAEVYNYEVGDSMIKFYVDDGNDFLIKIKE
jgi:hypothetical protein